MRRTDLHQEQTAGLHYLVSLPPDAGSGVRPLLVFLHGLGEGPPTDLLSGVTRHGPLRRGSSPRATGEFIIAAPQLPARGDLWRFYAEGVLAIVRQVQARHGGDPQRTCLTGFSFGANGVFDLALQAPSAWAALWAVDPTRVPAKDSGLPVWLSSGEASRYAARSFIDQLQLEMPADPAVQKRIYLDEGLDHTATATSAYADERIYRWLLAQKRPSSE